MTIVETRAVTGGVDTHLDVHVAAALDGIGGLLGVESFPTTASGYSELLGWLAGFGPVERVGIEGTGSYAPAWLVTSMPPGSTWWRSTAWTARPAASKGSPTHSTPSAPPAPPNPGRPRELQRAVTGWSRRSAR